MEKTVRSNDSSDLTPMSTALDRRVESSREAKAKPLTGTGVKDMWGYKDMWRSKWLLSWEVCLLHLVHC